MRQIARIRFYSQGEGFSGFVVGNFFLLRYHAFNGSEKQKLYIEETRRAKHMYNAFGLVKSGDYGSEIYCICTVGFLDPASVLFFLLVGVAASLYDCFLFQEPLLAIFAAVFVSVLLVVFSVIADSRACCAERGRRKILKFLDDPTKENQSI